MNEGGGALCKVSALNTEIKEMLLFTANMLSYKMTVVNEREICSVEMETMSKILLTCCLQLLFLTTFYVA